MVGVAAGPLGRVYVWRREKLGPTVVGEAHCPVVMVDEPVVKPAEQDAVVQHGRAAVDP